MDPTQFNAAVCNIIQMIPPHKITSCSHIAKLLGEPIKARRIGETFSSSLPWYRMISSPEILADGDLGCIQRSALESECVLILTGSYGESRVDFDQFGWFLEQVAVVSEAAPEGEWDAWA